jgi:hypothetical protein
MTYTFRSARYANAEGTAVVADTAEDAHVALSAADTPGEWAALMAAAARGEVAIAAYAAPAAPPQRTPAEKLAALLAAEGLTLAELEALLA